MAVQPRRAYRMASRAAPKAETERRLLEAAERLFLERPYPDVRLEDIASAAGVSAPTVIHRFGSKEALLSSVVKSAQVRVEAQRSQASAGDLDGAIKNLVEHYEHWGDHVMHLLSQEAAVPAIRQVTNAGRSFHVEWVERTFTLWLPRGGAARNRRLAQLVALMDVYVWKILRRECGLSRPETEKAIREMVSALLERDR
ncbi:MAG: TetR/AcrR family transcriptional regulator [Candidatus Dormibacteraceae bacterium]